MKKAVALSYVRRRTMFGMLVNFITKMGAVYKPKNINISAQALTDAHAKAAEVQQTFDEAATALAQARINSRNLFRDAKKTMARLILEMKSMDIDTQLIDKVKQLTKTYAYRSKSPVPAPAATTTTTDPAMPTTQRGTQKRSAQLRILEGVSKIVTFVTALPVYSSADENLTVKALIALRSDLEAALAQQEEAEIQHAQAAQVLRLLWNDNRTGLAVRFNQAKAHVQAVDTTKIYQDITKLRMSIAKKA